MKPEEQARQKIDRFLEQAGWAVQDHDRFRQQFTTEFLVSFVDGDRDD